MSSEFKTDVVIEDAVGIVRVRGPLDARNATALLNQCNELRRKGHPRLVINLSAVDFIASSGLGTILALCEEFKETGGRIRLADLSEPVSSVVDLLNLTEFLLIDSTEAAAVRALAA